MSFFLLLLTYHVLLFFICFVFFLCSHAESNQDGGQSRGQREVTSVSTTLRSRADLLPIHRSTVDLMALEKVAQGWPLLLRPGERLTEVLCSLVSWGPGEGELTFLKHVHRVWRPTDFHLIHSYTVQEANPSRKTFTNGKTAWGRWGMEPPLLGRNQ